MVESLRRSSPYFRIITGRGTLKGINGSTNSLNKLGKFSHLRGETHIDIAETSFRDIIDIIERFIKEGGKP